MEQLDQLKQQYTEHRQKALAVTEKAQREDRSLTDAEMAEVEQHIERPGASSPRSTGWSVVWRRCG